MLLGTSLGGCLRSLALGEVHKKNVLVIVTRTSAQNIEELLRVVETYHKDGNKHASVSTNYDMTNVDLRTLKDLAQEMYHHGKIHQPKLFNGYSGFIHTELSRNEIWIPLAPSPKTDNDVVIDAYEKFKMIYNLYR